MDTEFGEAPYTGIGQRVTALLLGVSPLYNGASLVFLLPVLSPPANETYQMVISLRVKILVVS